MADQQDGSSRVGEIAEAGEKSKKSTVGEPSSIGDSQRRGRKSAERRGRKSAESVVGDSSSSKEEDVLVEEEVVATTSKESYGRGVGEVERWGTSVVRGEGSAQESESGFGLGANTREAKYGSTNQQEKGRFTGKELSGVVTGRTGENRERRARPERREYRRGKRREKGDVRLEEGVASQASQVVRLHADQLEGELVSDASYAKSSRARGSFARTSSSGRWSERESLTSEASQGAPLVSRGANGTEDVICLHAKQREGGGSREAREGQRKGERVGNIRETREARKRYVELVGEDAIRLHAKQQEGEKGLRYTQGGKGDQSSTRRARGGRSGGKVRGRGGKEVEEGRRGRRRKEAVAVLGESSSVTGDNVQQGYPVRERQGYEGRGRKRRKKRGKSRKVVATAQREGSRGKQQELRRVEWGRREGSMGERGRGRVKRYAEEGGKAQYEKGCFDSREVLGKSEGRARSEKELECAAAVEEGLGRWGVRGVCTEDRGKGLQRNGRVGEMRYGEEEVRTRKVVEVELASLSVGGGRGTLACEQARGGRDQREKGRGSTRAREAARGSTASREGSNRKKVLVAKKSLRQHGGSKSRMKVYGREVGKEREYGVSKYNRGLRGRVEGRAMSE